MDPTTMDPNNIVVAECPSLEHLDIELSTTNRTQGTLVTFRCDDFGHRPAGGIESALCGISGNWSNPIPRECEWSWDFKTQDKIIFGTSVAAVSFVIIVAIAALIAYFRCYRNRDDDFSDDRMFSSSTPSSSPITGFSNRELDPYIIYQENFDKLDRYDGYHFVSELQEKPWLGFIPRPKFSQEAVYS